MCGIVGFVGLDLPADRRLEIIRRGMRAIAHRGPDETGVYHSRDYTLGTVRLSVIDPLLGHQPMVTDDGRYVVGFNGEVFNYIELRRELRDAGIRFHTNSDTEVLLQSLAHWGRGALDRLNGQYGLAFYDRLTRELVLARDPFGERPLVYTETGGGLAFASEIKGLFALPGVAREIDPGALRRAARYWSPLAGETCFRGVASIPPGHLLSIRDGQAELVRWYRGLDERGAPPETFEEGVAGLRERMADSVRLRLRGDYPLGAYISGGVDSAVTASLVGRLHDEPLRTFSLEIPDSPVDEEPYQRALVDRLGSRHSTVKVTGADVRERLPGVVHQCEQPFHLTAPVAYAILAGHVGASGTRIMLGGEGADEILLGYDIAKEAMILDRLRDTAPAELAPLLEGVLSDVRHSDSTPAAEILSFYAGRLGGEDAALGAHLRRFEAEPVDELFTAGEDAGGHAALLASLREAVPGFDRAAPAERSALVDLYTFLIGYGMTCLGDRAGTGCGVEGRYPFLDRRLVEYAYALPREWKLNDAYREKHILRAAFADEIPAPIAARGKFGMRVPGVEALLPSGEDDWVSDVLAPESVRATGFLDAAAVDRLARRVAEGVPDGRSAAAGLYVRVLTILLMERSLVRDYRVPDADIDSIMKRCVDGDEEVR
ncbi:asparagine synthase (glutamine-hydrolyzing) [Actinomadura rugatobispora]|uniref:asparagine synthase (glutamine-hydrolyzing) n=1 Tax=Actinomadura rugatobispora TaxID=1994 RepID=A0ABW0ZYL5_9ACTN|nr:asparagine synthase (glutamine-hydrolyzing) [Actinomadura rugatobispora]